MRFIRYYGSVAEWSKALVLGTSHFDGVGSNPTAASFFFFPIINKYTYVRVVRSVPLIKKNFLVRLALGLVEGEGGGMCGLGVHVYRGVGVHV